MRVLSTGTQYCNSNIVLFRANVRCTTHETRLHYSHAICTYMYICTTTTHIKNFKIVKAVVDGFQKTLGKKVLHGLFEQLGRLRFKVFDNIFLLHEIVKMCQGLHVVLSITKVHIKLI